MIYNKLLLEDVEKANFDKKAITGFIKKQSSIVQQQNKPKQEKRAILNNISEFK